MFTLRDRSVGREQRQVRRQHELRLQQREHQHRDHHQRNVRPDLPAHPAQPEHRREGHHRRQHPEDHHHPDLVGSLPCRLARVLAALDPVVDVLAGHDRVIHHDPQHQDEGEERDHVDRDPDGRHQPDPARRTTPESPAPPGRRATAAGTRSAPAAPAAEPERRIPRQQVQAPVQVDCSGRSRSRPPPLRAGASFSVIAR